MNAHFVSSTCDGRNTSGRSGVLVSVTIAVGVCIRSDSPGAFMMTNSRATAGSSPCLMRLSINICTTAAFPIAPSINAKRMLLPAFPVDPDRGDKYKMLRRCRCHRSRPLGCRELERSLRRKLPQALSRQRYKRREAISREAGGTSPWGSRTEISISLRATPSVEAFVRVFEAAMLWRRRPCDAPGSLGLRLRERPHCRGR